MLSPTFARCAVRGMSDKRGRALGEAFNDHSNIAGRAARLGTSVYSHDMPRKVVEIPGWSSKRRS
jgi:hypothetical protein